MKIIRLLLQAAVITIFAVTIASAVEIEVQGEGSAVVTQDIAAVQHKARQEAMKNAVTVALERVLGADADQNPKVQEKMTKIISQASVYKIKQNDDARREDDRYVVNTILVIDETKLRKLLSDMGIALNTATARASSIMVVMDEYFSLPSDLNVATPLREVTVYKYDRDKSFKDRQALSKSSSEASAVSARNKEAGSLAATNQASGSASAKSSGRVLTGDGYASGSNSADAKFSQKGSVDARYSKDQSLDAAHKKQSNLNYGRFVSASDSEHEFFTNIKEYQPRNTPDKRNDTVASLGTAFRTYDIRSLNSDIFRSKYFGKNPITIEKLENSEQLGKFAKAARSDAKADFFAIGTSVIVDRGKSTTTGMSTCDGMVAVKVYSTADSETIASGALTESASGNSPDQCRTNVANKIGAGLGSTVAHQIQDYWKTRQMYGSEYILVLVGDLPTMARIQFTNTVKQVQGVSNVKQRSADSGKVEFVVNYGGSGQVGDEIFMKLAESSLADRFANYEIETEGNQITLRPAGKKPVAAKSDPKKRK